MKEGDVNNPSTILRVQSSDSFQRKVAGHFLFHPRMIATYPFPLALRSFIIRDNEPRPGTLKWGDVEKADVGE